MGDVILDRSVYNRSGTTGITSTGGSAIQNDASLPYLDDTPLRVNTIASAAGDVSIVAPLASIADDNRTTAVGLWLAGGALADLWADLWDEPGLRAADSDGVAETTRGLSGILDSAARAGWQRRPDRPRAAL